jgi:hypothetical protein
MDTETLMEDKEQYKGLLSGIIAKQAVILGPQFAVLKARNIKELTVADDGIVTDFSGDPKEVVEKLVDEYIAIAGLIVKSTLKSVFDKYPSISPSGDGK